MNVSLIIRTRDEAKSIGDVLERIFKQKIDHAFEVIVVDSGSSDGTVEIAQAYDTKIFTIPASSFTYGYALNYGIERAQGSVISLLSAHCIPADDRWLTELISPLAENRADATYGRQIPIRGVNPFEEVSLDKHFPEKDGTGERVPFSNANCAFLKTMWQIRTFDEEIPGWEDYLWYSLQKARFRFLYCPESAVYHSHPFSIRNISERAYRDGRAFRIFQEKYGIDLVGITYPTFSAKIKAVIADMMKHAGFFWKRNYTKHLIMLPAVRFSVYLSYWRGMHHGVAETKKLHRI